MLNREEAQKITTLVQQTAVGSVATPLANSQNADKADKKEKADPNNGVGTGSLDTKYALEHKYSSELRRLEATFEKKTFLENDNTSQNLIEVKELHENIALLFDAELIKAILEIKAANPELKILPKSGGGRFGLKSLQRTVIFDDQGRAFALGEILGQGSQGCVRLGVDLDIHNPNRKANGMAHQYYAIKMIIKSRDLKKEYQQEIDHLKEWGRLTSVVESKDKLFIIETLVMGEDLFASLYRCKEFGRLHMALWLQMAHDALQSLQELHDRNIIHRDLKPNNILRIPGKSIVVDPGFAVKAVIHECYLPDNSSFDCVVPVYWGDAWGKTEYLSPDIQRGKKCLYSRNTDLYQMGIIFRDSINWFYQNFTQSFKKDPKLAEIYNELQLIIHTLLYSYTHNKVKNLPATEYFCQILQELVEKLGEIEPLLQFEARLPKPKTTFKLYNAIEKGESPEEILEYLEENPEYLYKSIHSNRTPFICAVRLGRKDIVAALIKRYSNILVNSIDEEGYSALQLAIIKGHRKIAELLLQAGACPNQLGRNRTALGIAASFNDISMMELLLAAKAEINPKSGIYPIQEAMHAKQPVAAYWLINHSKVRPLSIVLEILIQAIEKNENGLVREILAYEGQDRKFLMECVSRQCGSHHCINVAALHGNVEVLDRILTVMPERSKLSAQDSVLMDNSFMLAAKKGHLAYVEKLVKIGPEIIKSCFKIAFNETIKEKQVQVANFLLKQAAIVCPKLVTKEILLQFLTLAANKNEAELIKKYLDVHKDKFDQSNIEDLLVEAIRGGALEVVKSLVPRLKDINAHIARRFILPTTLLHLVCEKNLVHIASEMTKLKMLRYLIEKRGADPGTEDGHRYFTPFQKACEDGSIEVARYLVNHPKTYKHGMTLRNAVRQLICCAIFADKTQVVKDLFQKHKKLLVNNKEREEDETLLQIALNHARISRDETLVQYFIEQGIDVNADEGRDGPALNVAIREQMSAKTILMLIKAGADVDKQDYWKRTPLLEAILIGREDIVLLLLNAKAKVNAIHGRQRFDLLPDAERYHERYVNGLCHAVQHQLKRIVLLLLKAGVSPDLKNGDEQRPLDYAVQARDLWMVRVLLQYGADPHNLRFERSVTFEPHLPICQQINRLLYQSRLRIKLKSMDQKEISELFFDSLKNCDFSCAEIILELNPELVNVCDKNGFAPVTYTLNKLNFLQLLLRFKPNLESVNKNKQSLLYLAICNRFHEAANLLLNAGAGVSTNYIDDEGNSLLQNCIKFDGSENFALNVIKINNSIINQINKAGRTALGMAFEHLGSYFNLIRALMQLNGRLSPIESKDGTFLYAHWIKVLGCIHCNPQSTGQYRNYLVELFSYCVKSLQIPLPDKILAEVDAKLKAGSFAPDELEFLNQVKALSAAKPEVSLYRASMM